MVEEGEEEGEEGEGERKSAQTKFYDRSKFSRSKSFSCFQFFQRLDNKMRDKFRLIDTKKPKHCNNYLSSNGIVMRIHYLSCSASLFFVKSGI